MFVDLTLDAREGHAVVGGHDDQCVVQLADLLQLLHGPAQVLVEPLHLQGVIQHVAANDPVVGKILGQHDVGQLLACPQAGAWFVSAMRLVPTQPEAKRFVFRLLLQKVLEVPGVIFW